MRLKVLLVPLATRDANHLPVVVIVQRFQAHEVQRLLCATSVRIVQLGRGRWRIDSQALNEQSLVLDSAGTSPAIPEN